MKPAIVVYDGDCGVCELTRKYVTRFDWLHQFSFRRLQDMHLYLQFPFLSRAECEQEMKLVVDGTHIYGGADAMARVLSKLPLFFIVGWILRFPLMRPLARWGYRTFADNRHRVSAACAVEVKTP